MSPRSPLRLVLVAALALLAACGAGGSGGSAGGSAEPPDTQIEPGAAGIELYGTFHAMGVIVTLSGEPDPDHVLSATPHYAVAGSGSFREGFPLSRVADDRFVGSLFWLDPGTDYVVRIVFEAASLPAWDGHTLTETGATRGEIETPQPVRTLVVSPDGIGTACAPGDPCALSTALDLAEPGTEIRLLGGTYREGDLHLPRSGTEAAPIVIRSAPGEVAILDGTDPGPFAFAYDGDGVYATTLTTPRPHVVLHDGERLFPYPDRASLAALSLDGTSGFHAEGTTLYVHLEADAVPDPTLIEVSSRNNAFVVERDHIRFVDLVFRCYGQGDWAKALYLNNANDTVVQACTFEHNDLGVGIKRTSHRTVVQDSVFYDSIFDWPWDPIKTLGGIEDGGVRLYDPMDGRGTVIRRNVFRDDFDGFGACPGSSSAITNETDVYDNLVYNMGDDGMETDGQCSNVRIWNNTFHDVLMGISLAPVYTGPVYCIRNLIYRTGVGNNGYTGSPFKFNSGYARSGPMILLHNTADAALAGNNGLYIKAPGTWASIYARNNIWAGTTYAVNNYNLSQAVDLDYDDLWCGGGDLVRWGSVYADLGAFTAATGHEANGLSAPPGFTNAAAGDYTLTPGSALVDRGVPIPGINHDHAGASPDIGAFER